MSDKVDLADFCPNDCRRNAPHEKAQMYILSPLDSAYVNRNYGRAVKLLSRHS